MITLQIKWTCPGCGVEKYFSSADREGGRLDACGLCGQRSVVEWTTPEPVVKVLEVAEIEEKEDAQWDT